MFMNVSQSSVLPNRIDRIEVRRRRVRQAKQMIGKRSKKKPQQKKNLLAKQTKIEI